LTGVVAAVVGSHLIDPRIDEMMGTIEAPDALGSPKVNSTYPYVAEFGGTIESTSF